MRADARELVWIALAIALAVALVQSVRLWWAGASRARRLRAQAVRAFEGEARAEHLLRDAGFAILARQAAHRWFVRVDGTPVCIDLRADYIVQYGARRFVAEVKTGRTATRIDSAATRRQMLEYRCAFDVDGVLLVDADAETIHAVEFELPRRPPHESRWLTAAVLLAIAAGAIGVRLWR